MDFELLLSSVNFIVKINYLYRGQVDVMTQTLNEYKKQLVAKEERYERQLATKDKKYEKQLNANLQLQRKLGLFNPC